jgi:hypothetical protein
MTSSSGWSVSGMGDLISDFGVACPLDGHQTELRPAQMQQRSAVQAQVVVMTAPAFVAMSPDRHVLRESLSFPELVQFTRDLVIVDEADAVQCAFDDHFTLDAPIMGADERSYLPQSAVRVHSALQEQGGAQYASRLDEVPGLATDHCRHAGAAQKPDDSRCDRYS